MDAYNPQTVATANAMSGERTFRTFNVPATGNDEADCIVAIQEILKTVSHRMAFRICEYLAHRYEDVAKMQESMWQKGQAGVGGCGNLMSPGYAPQAWPSVTTTGVNELPDNLKSILKGPTLSDLDKF